MIGIYKFTNKITNESYIGQSRDIHKRYLQHKNRYDIDSYNPIPKEDTYFHSMLRHYGFNNFDFEIIEECSIDELNDKEIYYIEHYNTLYPNGYNKDMGGNTPHPMKFTSYKQVDEVILLLNTTKMPNVEIGELYGVSDQTISDINNGRIWKKDDITYPIRNGRIIQSKNKKSNYYCQCCGKEQSYRSKTGLCLICYSKKKSERIPNKETLYDLLLHNSFCSVGRLYGVSDNAVKRWCDKYNLPRYSSYYRNIV